ncbi:MAG: MBL fold metallo-hydrolase RNA specificity domain-containing protein [Vulcanimicrobiaceae bacterium]
MAELTFVGAAGTVTGSKHLLTIGGRHLFVDCGLFQGMASVTALNNVALPVAPAEIEAVVVTHGHIDHVGYLPKLVKDGFRGRIICTPATAALMQIVLDDAANLQEHMAQRGFDRERNAPPPFYTEQNVIATMRLVESVPVETNFSVCGVNATFHNAAHIIGSAFVVMEIEGRRVLFSGDIGRYGRALLNDPAPAGNVDVMLCESTYGDRVHPPDALDRLGAVLVDGVRRGGAIVIPAFAVERSQDILLSIGVLQEREPTLASVPVFLDSPMAAQVDRLFEQFPESHKPVPNDTQNTPFGCRNLTVAVTTEQSKAINGRQGPHIIVSASGMASGGRVLHHLHNHITDPKATMLFVGYQGAGTLGFFVTHGVKSVRIYGDTLGVEAYVAQIEGYSAHADRNELFRWLSTCTSKPHLYAVHGEPASAAALAQLAQQELGWQGDIGRRGTTVSL